MNIYLDIDGVLLTEDGDLAPYLKEFLEFVTTNHTCFWLTTHCKGNNTHTISHLRKILPQELWGYIDVIKPTNWDVLKTDAIDFTQNFLWFDDAPMESEIRVLTKHNTAHKLVNINLKKIPYSLKDILTDL